MSSLPRSISGSGVHPQHDLLLVYHYNAVSCSLCSKPLAGLHAYNCATCMFNVDCECIFGSVQPPQPPHVVVAAASVQKPQPPRVVHVQPPPAPNYPPPAPNNVQPPAPRRGLGSIIAGSAIAALVSEIVKDFMRGDDY
ncbi:hypothetical protein GQ55_8G233500 [Panicum hallii var. hallii]|uniref:DC1 domain-containing protein n=1 Tax=Panicum hallii var. hallii TaxID=1504633 RepID=A0A2T7CQE8_9POAL|nr:hypothetical protein GQ55_8G233500 [Panicum hallii var. hallii]